jgi:hypothetical protein
LVNFFIKRIRKCKKATSPTIFREEREKCQNLEVEEEFIPSCKLVITGFMPATPYFVLIEYFAKFFKM